MILNHAIKDAPRSRQHYDVHHYIPEKRRALTQWVRRLTKILGYNPNDVMKGERRGYQGKGTARKIGRRARGEPRGLKPIRLVKTAAESTSGRA
jgi:hypothetical protein